MDSLFCNTTIEQIIPNTQKMIVISSTKHVPDAFKTLVQNNIYSAPVMNLETKEYYGFIDLLDIVTFIVKIIEEQLKEEGKAINSKGIPQQDFYSLLEVSEAFDWTTVNQIIDLSKRNPMCPIRKKESVFEALKVFKNTGAHKLPVLQSPWSVENVLTQSTIISWLDKNINQLEAMKDMDIRELGLGYKPVIAVNINSPVVNAFKLMAEKRISSVAVVDEKGQLLDNLSAKDIKIIEPDILFTKLFYSVAEFLSRAHEKVVDRSTIPAIYCYENCKYAEVIHKLANMKIHRIYVTDENKFPIGVISCGDAINALLQIREMRISK